MAGKTATNPTAATNSFGRACLAGIAARARKRISKIRIFLCP
jgi:hypothetical protein